MKLLFTGTFPFWAAALLFALLVFMALRLYRQENLPRPWSWLLPATRLAVYGLLCLCLLQPVLSRQSTLTRRGLIPVIVDNSGSMSIRSFTTPGQQLKLAWLLGKFQPHLRDTRILEVLAPLSKNLSRIQLAESQARDLQTELAEAPVWTPEISERAGRLAESASELSALLSPLLSGLESLEEDIAEVPIRQVPGSEQGLTLEVYKNIGGSDLASLRQHANFPDKPDETRVLSTFRFSDLGDNYGTRLRGWIKAPQSGDYHFMVASDDQSEVYLSSDATPANQRRIAGVASATNDQEWSRDPGQKSEIVKLVQDQIYYIETLHKEGGGGDHLSLAWTLPDGSEEKPIHERHLFVSYQTLVTERLAPIAAKLEKNSADLARELKRIAAKTTLDTAHLDKLLNDSRELFGALPAFAETLSRAQDSADEQLASSDQPEIVEALKQVKDLARIDAVKALLDPSNSTFLERLRAIGDVEIFSLDEKIEALSKESLPKLGSDQSFSRLGSVLRDILRSYENRPISAVLFLSDGANNSGLPLVQARKIAAERGIPVLAAGVGSSIPPVDVALESVDAPRTSFSDDLLNISVELSRHGLTDRELKLVVMSNTMVVHQQTVPAGGPDKVSVHLAFKEKRSGVQHYELRVEEQSGEITQANNKSEFAVDILKDRIRTLLLDEFPRWESRYASMMLKRDRRIDLLTTFTAAPAKGRMKTGSNSFPKTREELFAYHILVLGDVDPQRFSPEQLESIKAFVVERGGTVILMAGTRHMPQSYAGTLLSEIIPVRSVGAATPPSSHAVHPLVMLNAATGEDLLHVGLSPKSSRKLWEGLPGMNWVHPGVRVSPAADELVQVRGDGPPVIVKSFAGLGKVLYLGSDSFWRWRYRARWTYHHRLWGKILLWATEGRTAGDDPHVKLMTEHPYYTPDATVRVKAQLFDGQRKPLLRSSAMVQVFDAENKLVRHLELVEIENSGGQYTAQITGLPKGKYVLRPKVPELQNVSVLAEATFEVKDLPTSEYVELTVDEKQLKQLADEVRPLERVNELIDLIPAIEKKETLRSDIEIWDSFWLICAAALLLGFEWLMRKKHHLV